VNKEGAEQKHSELRGRRRWLLTTREHGGAINMTTPKIPSDQARVPNVGEESSAEKRTWSRWIADVSPMTVRFHRFRPGSEASHITITNVRFGSNADISGPSANGQMAPFTFKDDPLRLI